MSTVSLEAAGGDHDVEERAVGAPVVCQPHSYTGHVYRTTWVCMRGVTMGVAYTFYDGR